MFLSRYSILLGGKIQEYVGIAWKKMCCMTICLVALHVSSRGVEGFDFASGLLGLLDCVTAAARATLDQAEGD